MMWPRYVASIVKRDLAIARTARIVPMQAILGALSMCRSGSTSPSSSMTRSTNLLWEEADG